MYILLYCNQFASKKSINYKVSHSCCSKAPYFFKFANDMKKSEEGLKASKLKKVELCISIDNLILTETKTKVCISFFQQYLLLGTIYLQFYFWSEQRM